MRLFSSIKKVAIAMSIVMLVSSCSNKSTEYTNAIPADAPLVVAFDFKSLALKGGIGENSVKDAIDKIFGGLPVDEENQEVMAMMEKIAKNPMESGLSLGDKAYFFILPEQEKPAMLFEVDDIEKLKDVFKVIAKNDGCTPLSHKAGAYSTVIDNEIYCVFNKTTFIATKYYRWDEKEVKDDILELLKQPHAKSINTDAGFRKMNDEMNDVGLFVTMEGIFDIYDRMLDNVLPDDFDPEGTSIIADLNFKNGEITFSFKYFTTNPKNNKFLDEQMKLYNKSSNKFLSTLPYSSFAYAGSSINGEETYKMVMKRSEFAEMKEEAAEEGIDIERILKSFNGDLLMAVTGMASMDMPAFTCYAEVKDDYLLQLLMSKKDKIFSDENFKQISATKFSYTNRQFTVYFGIEGNVIYCTNEKSVSENVAQKISNSAADNPISTRAKDSYGYFIVDIDAIMANPIIRMLLAMGGKDAAMAMSVVTHFSHIEMIAPAQNIFEYNIHLKNKDKNSLNIVINEVLMPVIMNFGYRIYESDMIIESDEAVDAVEEVVIEEDNE